VRNRFYKAIVKSGDTLQVAEARQRLKDINCELKELHIQVPFISYFALKNSVK